MKVVHICISAPYIDGWGYQENLLPEYMSLHGAENHIIAPSDNFPAYLKKDTIDEIQSKGNEYQLGSVKIHRIKTIRVSSSLLYTKGLMPLLETISPDAIFHHNFNCSSLPIAARYAKQNDIPLLVDNHADDINMTGNALWAFVYYRVMIRLAVLFHNPWIHKAYGVTHSRCNFMKDNFGVPQDKIDFLPIGGDSILASTIPDNRALRSKYGLDKNSIVYVSGGKMGVSKGTDILIKAYLAINDPTSKLILFGKFEDVETETLAKNTKGVIVYGWCDRVKTLELLKVADVACWPLLHTTLIEDAISVGTPVAIKKSATSEHLVEDNGTWILKEDVESVKNALLSIVKQDRKLLSIGINTMRHKLDYNTIADTVVKSIYEYKR